jgi:hypothetical protein
MARAQECLSRSPRVTPAMSWLQLSIAEYHLGHAEAARKWLAKADHSIEQMPNVEPDEFWFDICLLRYEADALLAGRKSPWN